MNFKELATARFSVRKFTDEAVSQADLDAIMTCVQLAPSACNRQPWKFLLLASDESKEKIRQCYDRPWFASAPIYVLCMKDTANAWVRPDDGKSHGDIDLGIAVEHLALAAADRGLGTCWVCHFAPEAMRAELGRPAGVDPVNVLTVGYADEEPVDMQSHLFGRRIDAATFRDPARTAPAGE